MLLAIQHNVTYQFQNFDEEGRGSYEGLGESAIIVSHPLAWSVVTWLSADELSTVTRSRQFTSLISCVRQTLQTTESTEWDWSSISVAEIRFPDFDAPESISTLAATWRREIVKT